MELQQLRPGLWRWTAPHPDWKPEDGGAGGWDQDVACFYYEGADALVLIDPLAPPEGTPDAERFWRALDGDVQRLARPVAVLLTAHWHDRSAQAVYDRYRAGPGAAVWALASHRDRVDATVTQTYATGDVLPGGVRAAVAARVRAEDEEGLFYLPDHRALVAGDILVGEGDGELRLGWVDLDPATRQRLIPSLQALLRLPLELVLVTHGRSTLDGGRAALERALERPPWNR